VSRSSACRRVRRDSAPAGGSLWWLHNFASQSEHPPAARTFVASNESNQSKDALHLGVTLRLQGLAGHCHGPLFGRTHAAISSPHASLRIGAKTPTGKVCAANNCIALGPRGGRRGAQGFGAARDSALRELTSRRLSERRERSEHSEFGARPQSPSTAEQSALGRPPPSGRLSFGSFSLAKQRKGTALSGAHPDAASRSEQELQKQSQASIPQPERIERANNARPPQ